MNLKYCGTPHTEITPSRLQLSPGRSGPNSCSCYTMNHLPEKERAQITVILCHLISQLACGDKDIDERTAAVISEVLELCCKSKMETPSGAGRTTFIEALELATGKTGFLRS